MLPPRNMWCSRGAELAGVAWPQSQLSLTVWQPGMQAMRWEREVQERNRPLADEELDAMLPSEGYKILEPPPGCVALLLLQAAPGRTRCLTAACL